MAEKVVLMSIVIFAVLLLAPTALAAETAITVKTITYHDVSIYVLDANQAFYMLESFHKPSSNKGEIKVVSIVNESKVKIRVLVKKNNNPVVSETFENQPTGKPLTLELYPEGYIAPQSQNTENNSTNAALNQTNNSIIENSTIASFNATNSSQENIAQEQLEGITGQVTADDLSSFKNIWWYGVLGIIVIGAIIFLLIKGISLRSQRNTFSPTPKAVLGSSSSAGLSASERKALLEAEQKIRDAQEQINALKNKEKISALERKIAQDKAEIERLKSS